MEHSWVMRGLRIITHKLVRRDKRPMAAGSEVRLLLLSCLQGGSMAKR
jgi:hypothetical protein